MKFKITALTAQTRLDLFLANELKDNSRSQIQKLIKAGQVKVNGKIISAHYNLKEDDEIVIEKIKIKKEKEIIKEANKKLPKVKIVADEKDYLVVNKPAGITVHGAPNTKETTLIDILLKDYPAISKIGEDPLRPGIVHRIDKDVSGLVLIAKNQAAFDNFKKQFQDRKIHKQYITLIYGTIAKDEDTINFPIERSVSGHKMAALPLTYRGKEVESGRRAITEFSTLQRFINFTLLKVRIKTGRTHQIRVHMAAYGHPIVGDELYGTHKTKLQNKKLNLGRIFLVASELGFKDLSGERKDYKIDLPANLKKLLKEIK